MSNTIDWGEAHINNTNEYGKGSEDNLISWGIAYGNTWFGQTLVESAEDIAQLLLDLYPAQMAYSLDKIKSDYTGSAVTVRRSSNGDERDFGFNSSGSLDTGSLERFVDGRDRYISDYTTGTDDMLVFNATLTSNESIAGEDSALKVTSAVVSGAQVNTRKSGILYGNAGQLFRLQAKVYIPSTNSGIDGIRVWTGYSAETFATVTTTDTWVEIDQSVNISLGSQIYISAMDGVSTSVTTTGADVFYVKDLKITRPDVNQYTSDFTTGNEDLTESVGTGTDGQSVAGVDDAYKFTLNGGSSANHYAQRNGTLKLNYGNRVTFDYYIPSTNTAVDGVMLRTGAIGDGEYNQTTLDAWTTATVEFTPTGNANLRFNATDGGSRTVDANDDVFYLKNIVVTELADPQVNMVLYSNDFSNGVYGNSGGRLSVTGSQPGYDGSNDAWLLNKTDAGNYYYFQSNLDNFEEGDAFTMSIYAKSGSADGITLYGHDWVKVDLTTGTVLSTGNSPVATSVTDVGGGWYRISVSGDFDNATWNRAYFKPVDSTGSDTTGNIYIQDLQVEKGTTVSTYNETTNSQNGFGYVVEWKDQSGNGNNATQTNESQQPKIVDAGSVLVDGNGKAKIKATEATQYLEAARIDPNPLYAFYTLEKGTSTSAFAGFTGQWGNSYAIFFGSTRASVFDTSGTRHDVSRGTTMTSGNRYLISAVFDNDIEIYQDGTLEGSVSGVGDLRFTDASQKLFLFGYSGGNADPGSCLQEVILYNSDQSGNRVAIETDINSRYNIYS